MILYLLHKSNFMNSKETKQKTFNIITAGYGGQGVLTLAEILARAAFNAGNDMKQAELHGLAQRGGALFCHIRFGEKVHSPLVAKGGADLIIALEAVEALRSLSFANKETVLVYNEKVFAPAQTSSSGPSLDEVKKELEKNLPQTFSADADNVVREITGDVMSVNIYMLGFALAKGVLPLEEDVVWEAVKEKIGERFWDQNRKVFNATLTL